MCVVKTPSIQSQSQTDAAANKPLPILRNPILDGMLGNVAALRAGTSAFRIDLINPLKIPAGGGPGAGSGGGGGGSGSSGSGAGGGGTSGGGGSSGFISSGGGGSLSSGTGGRMVSK